MWELCFMFFYVKMSWKWNQRKNVRNDTKSEINEQKNRKMENETNPNRLKLERELLRIKTCEK